MRFFFVALIIVAAITVNADDIGDLEAASIRYVATMKAATTLSDEANCFQVIAKA